MRRLNVSLRIDAPLEVVWDLLVSVQHWPRWGPSVRGVELDTARIAAGSRGTVITRGGLRLRFEISSFEADRSWSWRVAGVPATDHRVQADGDGTIVGFGVPVAVAPYAVVCAVALRRLDRLSRRSSGPGAASTAGSRRSRSRCSRWR